VTSLTEKLQGKVTTLLASTMAQEVHHLDDQNAVTGTEKLLAQQLKEALGSGDCAVHGVLSSEEDGGVVSDEDCIFFDFPDTLFAVGAAEEVDFGSLASLFWN
jgi:homeobox-leucine zipper protein